MATVVIKAGYIEHEIHIKAPPHIVFEYFTQSEKMIRWKGQRATLDPRPGGLYHVLFDDGNSVRGEFRAVQPYTRIVFTWGWEGDDEVPPGSSTVEVKFNATEDGTQVILRHTGLPSASLPKHSHGWSLFGDRLVTAIGSI